MGTTQDLHERITKRTRLSAHGGIELVPVGILFFVFGLGELGWQLGPWYLPSLAAAAVIAVFGTAAAVYWRQRRYGHAKLYWDHRVTVLVLTLAAAHVAVNATASVGPASVYLPGLTLGLVLAAMSLWSPYALAQHLVFGLLVAILSVLPLGTWFDVPVPPARATALGAQPHPLALLQPLIVPIWLIATGVAGHVRLTRALAQPVLERGDTETGVTE